jgi:hypothetical protein
MTRTQLLTVSLMLPFMAVSGVVHANPATTRNQLDTSLSFSSHAEMRSEGSGAYGQTEESPRFRYLGGPKSGLLAYQGEFAHTHPGGR